MKEDGKLPVRFIKILLTGSGAAGKTSFSNLLMKKAINQLHHSTNVVQAKHAISVRKGVMIGSKEASSDMECTVWIEMDNNSEISHLRQILLTSNKPKVVQEKCSTSAQLQEDSSGIRNGQNENPIKNLTKLIKSQMATMLRQHHEFMQ